MEPSLYAYWSSLSQLVQADSSSHDQSTQSSSIFDDGTKDRSNAATVSTNGGVGSPLAHGGTLDLSDFVIGDLGSTSSASSMVSPTSSYFTSYQQPSTSYYMPSSYGATPYGSLWSNQNVPLSNYSSLNGASSSSSSNTGTATPSQTHSSPPVQHAQTHQPQSHGHSSPPLKSPASADSQMSNSSTMMIDPSLTTLDGSGSINMQSYSSLSYSPTATPQQQQLSSYQVQQLLASVYGRSYMTPQPQQQQQPEHQYQTSTSRGTVSPQALHSSTSSMMQTIAPSSFYGTASSPPIPSTPQLPTPPVQPVQPVQLAQPPPPPPEPKITLEERNEKLLAVIKPMLNPKQFSGAGAVTSLSDKIDDFPAAEVPAATRLEILTKIRDGAGNDYFRAWADNPTAMDITRDWLKAAYMADPESRLLETIMPLLHIIDRLPLTLDALKASKLGKLVVKLVKEPPTPAIKDMVANIERRWRSLISNQESGTKSSESEDLKSKKRKLETAASKAHVAPPAKKPAVGSTNASKPVSVKKEPTSTSKSAAAPGVKDAKSDSSFFSAPKPKPKLPSFSKKPPPVSAPARGAALNIAQPSAEDPFQEALKLMANRRKESGKKKKTVSWAIELVSVRLIEKAIYDDDPKDGVHIAHSIRELDRSEGAALHAHMFEEAIDWIEPLLIDWGAQPEPQMRGESSEEKVRQEQREATALGALYMSLAQIPDSPAEPAHVISEEETDKNVTIMICGPEAEDVFKSGPPVTGQQSVADLVGQLASGNMAVDSAVNNTPFNSSGLDLGAVGLQQTSPLSAITGLPQEQLQQLLQQLAANQGSLPNLFGMGGGEQQPQQPPYGNGADQAAGGWGTTNNYGSVDYPMGSYQDESESRGNWRGGGFKGARGRGRGGRQDGGFRRPRPYLESKKRKLESATSEVHLTPPAKKLAVVAVGSTDAFKPVLVKTAQTPNPSLSHIPLIPKHTPTPPQHRVEGKNLRDATMRWLQALFHNKDRYRTLLALKGSPAQTVVNLLQELLDSYGAQESTFRKEIIVTLQKLAYKAQVYPSSYQNEAEIVPDFKCLMGGGGYGEIFKCQQGGQAVCVKMIRLTTILQGKQFMKQFIKEATLWAQLSHPNIVPFQGFFYYLDRPCLVSPWLSNGHINDYLRNHSPSNRYLLVKDMTEGLQYLHSWDIVHGDLKGANVMVDDSGRARLTDFGISSIFEVALPHWSSCSTVASKGGTIRWQAPELFASHNDQDVHNTIMSDVYAWGCTCYEIFAGKLPFHEIPKDFTVMFQVLQDGLQPSRPSEDDPAWLSSGLKEQFWDLMERCWTKAPGERPSVEDLLTIPLLDEAQDNRPSCVWPESSTQYRATKGASEPTTFPTVDALERILSGDDLDT